MIGFQFVEDDLIDGLYWETWYNRGYRNAEVRCPDGKVATAPCEVPIADRNVMYENRVLGLPRMRMVTKHIPLQMSIMINKGSFQLKVGNLTCDIPNDFVRAIRVCYAPYAETHEDMETYIPSFRKYTSEFA